MIPNDVLMWGICMPIAVMLAAIKVITFRC